MRPTLFRSLTAGAFLFLPACASVAQDPRGDRQTVTYTGEELDNLVAPVALYPDALLAQILVAATFPEQVEIASQYVRERGTRGIDDQGWDLSVKAVAHYPPVLNMLANDGDWSVALGQAYAAQSGDVMDAVQRMREMAREQGNLVSTPEHTVSYDRERIVIVPANPQVIYVPTYDPAIVYVRPVFGFGFHARYFSFGIGFPIGSWLVYDMDWYGRRVYYDGWYGGGWRTYARPYIHMTPVYVHPRYRVIHINVNIFSRHVNYVNLDRRHRYVRRTVSYERHDRDWRRYANRGGRNDDTRGPGRPADRGGRDDNDRIGNRVATFDDYRPDRGGTQPDSRAAEPRPSNFGVIDKRREAPAPRGRVETGSFSGTGSKVQPRAERPTAPVFSSPGKSATRKATTMPTPRPSSGGYETRQSPRVNGNGSGFQGASAAKVKPGGGTPRVAASTPRASSSPRASAGGASVRGGGSVKAKPSGGSGGSARVSSGGGNGGKVKPAGGGGGQGGGKRKP